MIHIPEQGLPTIYLKPGEAHFSSYPVRVTTVLGSCVSVIMYSSTKKIGSICHAVMPTPDVLRTRQPSQSDMFRYVDRSIEWMISQFEKALIKKGDLEVKIYGGAELFTHHRKGTSTLTIGRKNVETALKIILVHKLKLRAWDIGGNKGRKIVFYTETGDVLSKYVRKSDLGTTTSSQEEGLR